MGITVWSWHCNSDYNAHRITESSFPPIPPLKRNYTHFRVPVCMEFVPDKLHTEPEEVLQQAFHFFNWVSQDYVAPEKVNEFARKYGSHASQSVGDMVEIVGEGYWMVMPFGWEKLKDEDLYGYMTETV